MQSHHMCQAPISLKLSLSSFTHLTHVLDTLLLNSLCALSFNLTERQRLCIVFITPILQMRKLGSEKLNNLPLTIKWQSQTQSMANLAPMQLALTCVFLAQKI